MNNNRTKGSEELNKSLTFTITTRITFFTTLFEDERGITTIRAQITKQLAIFAAVVVIIIVVVIVIIIISSGSERFLGRDFNRVDVIRKADLIVVGVEASIFIAIINFGDEVVLDSFGNAVREREDFHGAKAKGAATSNTKQLFRNVL